MPDLAPTVTFIMPIQGRPEFLVEQINAVFRFSIHYSGFCELIVVVDETAKETEAIAKIVGLAVKINRANHPHVRARILRSTSSLSMNESVEMALTHSLGDRIMIVANGGLDRLDSSKLCGVGVGQKNVLITEYFLDETMFGEFLAKQ